MADEEETARELAERGVELSADELGKGSTCVVRKAFCRQLGRAVAVKIIDKRATTAHFVKDFLPRELAVVLQLHHPNIVETYNVLHVGERVCMIEELAENGDLLSRIQRDGHLTDTAARPLIRQLVEALHYLHSRQLAHRDLKCENVLLDADDNVKLADFGFVRRLRASERSRTFCGSRAYAAPEILSASSYDARAADVFSLGVLLYIALTGYMPYDERQPRKMIDMQRRHVIPYGGSRAPVGAVAKTLLHRLLHPTPDLRPTCAQIVDSDWLRDTPWLMRGAEPRPPSPAEQSTSSERLMSRVLLELTSRLRKRRH